MPLCLPPNPLGPCKNSNVRLIKENLIEEKGSDDKFGESHFFKDVERLTWSLIKGDGS